MHVFVALGRNDLRSVRRDSLLAGVVLLPWLLVAGLRLVVPPFTAWLAGVHGFNATPFTPLILSLFCVLQIPLVVGMLTGFLVLDERDDGTLTALRVTPLSLEGYARYRIMAAVLLSAAFILISIPLSGLRPQPALAALAPVALLAGLFAPIIALLLATFAGNKVEGMALSKGFALLLLGPLAAYFLPDDRQVLLGLLPTFWPAKAYWVASAGGAPWPYLLAGLAYHLAALGWLLRRFQTRLDR